MSEPDTVAKHRQRLIDAARLYAAADASDPFALDRALCHIKSGICRPRAENSGEYGLATGQDAFYDATPMPEQRKTADGTEYVATMYHNRVRP